MSCSTAYLVRDADGIWRVRWEKYGIWRLLDARHRDGVLADMRERGWYLDGSSPGWLSGWLCRGVMLDMVARRLRVYACSGADILQPKAGWIESVERTLARAPVWAGWDVGYAWGGREDFAELVPEAATLVEPELFERASLTELGDVLLDWEDCLIEWDRPNMRLRYLYEPWSCCGGLLSVIDERLEVLDYGFMHDVCTPSVLPWLTHGEALLDALAARAPHSLPYERGLAEGVIIDCPARRIRYWSGLAIPASLLASLRAAWPGYAIERLRYGYAGHLAATGRRQPDALLPESELPTVDEWGGTQFDPDWLRERASLRLDARGLRCIHEVWDDLG